MPDISTGMPESPAENRFDSRASSWDREPRRVRLARDVADGIVEAAAPSGNTDAADIGCGTGLLTLFLQPHVRSIDGIDSSAGMLAVLEGKIRDRGLSNVSAVRCDLEKREVPPRRYHLLVTSMTLHHIGDIPGTLQLFAQLLHPGGTLCIADLDREDWTFHDDPSGVRHPGIDRVFLKEALAAAGFRRLRERTVSSIHKSSAERSRDYPVFLITGENGEGEEPPP